MSTEILDKKIDKYITKEEFNKLDYLNEKLNTLVKKDLKIFMYHKMILKILNYNLMTF